MRIGYRLWVSSCWPNGASSADRPRGRLQLFDASAHGLFASETGDGGGDDSVDVEKGSVGGVSATGQTSCEVRLRLTHVWEQGRCLGPG